MRRSYASLIGLAFLVGGANPTFANLITVNFTGHLVFLPSDLSSVFSINDPMTVSITYDSSVGPTTSTATEAFYRDAITAASFTVGGFSGVLAPTFEPDNDIHMFNSPVFDGMSLAFGFTLTPNLLGETPWRFAISLNDPSATAFDALTLPASVDLADFSGDNQWVLTFLETGVGGRFGIPVSEPSSLSVLAVGLLSLCAFLRRRTVQREPHSSGVTH